MGIEHRARVVEIVRPVKSGFTQPYLCRLDDENLYAVKGRGALPEGLLAEVCAAILGISIGLPIPDFAIADLPTELISGSDDPELANYLGTGVGFASLWQNACEPLTPTMRDHQNPAVLATLYAFDHWIANGDRSLGEEDGNPNLLIQLSEKRLVVFDHNLAFSPQYRSTELVTHAGLKGWKATGRSTGFIPNLQDRMRSAREVLDQLLGDLPDEWTDERPDFLGTLGTILDRSEAKDFWAELS